MKALKFLGRRESVCAGMAAPARCGPGRRRVRKSRRRAQLPSRDGAYGIKSVIVPPLEVLRMLACRMPVGSDFCARNLVVASVGVNRTQVQRGRFSKRP